MGLRTCPDCRASVSKKAPACPSCGRPLKRPGKTFGGCSGCLFLALASLACLAFVASKVPRGNPSPVVSTALLPSVAAWFRDHDDFGKPVGSEDTPNWARGKRQRITTDQGRQLLFYEKEGKIVSVWNNEPSSGRVIVWGATESY